MPSHKTIGRNSLSTKSLISLGIIAMKVNILVFLFVFLVQFLLTGNNDMIFVDKKKISQWFSCNVYRIPGMNYLLKRLMCLR